jgi:diacylglycerol kinase (ATP)
LETFRAKRAAVIYNPVARTLSRNRQLLQRSIEALRSHGIETRLIATTAPNSAGAQARQQIDSGCDLILAAGGDGTINEVAAGMLHSGVPLGILPGGTANVLAREMKMPMNMARVAESIGSMTPVCISAGLLRAGEHDRRTFLCMAGAGLDAEIVCNVDLDLKAAIGKLAYYVGGFGQVFRPLTEFEVSVDGKKYEASFALISRVRNYGGDLEIAKRASLLRDDFEVVLFRGKQSYQYLPYLLGVAIGQTAKLAGCTMVHGSHVLCHSVAGKDVFAQVDGELVGKLDVTAEILPQSLTLLMPDAYLAKEQAYTEAQRAHLAPPDMTVTRVATRGPFCA